MNYSYKTKYLEIDICESDGEFSGTYIRNIFDRRSIIFNYRGWSLGEPVMPYFNIGYWRIDYQID